MAFKIKINFFIHFILYFFLLNFVVLAEVSKKYSTIKKNEDNFELKIISRNFSQGDLIFFQLNPKLEKFKKVNQIDGIYINDVSIPLTKKDQSYYSFYPIHPEEKKKEFVIKIQNQDLVSDKDVVYTLPITKTKFEEIKISKINVDQKYTSPSISEEITKFINSCVEKKAEIFKITSDWKFFKNFQHPIKNVFLTSTFYKKRVYNDRNYSKPHGGIDYRAKEGDNIYAINDGVVVLAQKMYYEGNFTVIDHGENIFSLYMHQAEINVKEGEKVDRGQLIGKVGQTGMVTGPHLHLGLKVKGVMIDPLSVMDIDVFN